MTLFDPWFAIATFIVLFLLAASAGCFYVAWRHRWWPFKIFMGLLGITVFSVLASIWHAAGQS